MTDTDPFDAAAYNRRENRRTNLLAGLVAAIVVLALMLGGLGWKVLTSANVIDRIDEVQADGRCSDALTLRFIALIVRAIGVPIEQRQPIIEALDQATADIEEAGLPDGDPCAILGQFPEPPVLPTPATTEGV